MVATAQTEEVGEGARRGSGRERRCHRAHQDLAYAIGAELVDIQPLLRHVKLSTTQIYTHVSEDRMAGVVAGH